jgi:hypothetical protein
MYSLWDLWEFLESECVVPVNLKELAVGSVLLAFLLLETVPNDPPSCLPPSLVIVEFML